MKRSWPYLVALSGFALLAITAGNCASNINRQSDFAKRLVNGNILLDAIRQYQRTFGRLPNELSDLKDVDTTEWCFKAVSPTTFLLVYPHDPWISSFNALIYTNDDRAESKLRPFESERTGQWSYIKGFQNVMKTHREDFYFVRF